MCKILCYGEKCILRISQENKHPNANKCNFGVLYVKKTTVYNIHMCMQMPQQTQYFMFS